MTSTAQVICSKTIVPMSKDIKDGNAIYGSLISPALSPHPHMSLVPVC